MNKTTLRSHIYIVNFSLCFWGLACGPSKPKPQSPQTESGAAIQDLNKDGKPDRWTWSNTSNSNPIKEEADLNFDGKIDIRKAYREGTLETISIDLDFDGQFDLEEFYNQGLLTKSEAAYGFSGKKDTWKYYENGLLERIEKDSNGDGSPDQWMYFKNQKLVRQGTDYNHDGVVDHWEDASK